jgi:hypothetical protein
MNMHSRIIRGLAAACVVACVVAPFLSSRQAESFPKWHDGSGTGWCANCHSDFNDGFSPKGSIFFGDSKHLMHRASSQMNTDCSLCHYDGDGNNPDLNFSDSDGFDGGPGVGCLGCHGRDYGDPFGTLGVGLREHHREIGVATCGATSCHASDPEPLPENVAPPYYGSFMTRAWSACNTFSGEDFTLDAAGIGLDNDGDLLYDEDDPDCTGCAEDLNNNGQVDFADILVIIGAWGPCPPVCPEDLNDNGQVDFADILVVIGAWGPCP